MDTVKLSKQGNTLTVPLPAEMVEALGLAENDVLAVQHVGNEIVLRRAAPENLPTPPLSAIELMKLPIAERHRLLAQAAAEAAEEYRTNPELMEFSTALDGEDCETDSCKYTAWQWSD
jgi:antitoxin component of MazEF toxin-antitoxin module